MVKHCACSILRIACIYISLMGCAIGAELDITIEGSAVCLQPFDPLFLKVTLKNNHNKAVPLSREIASALGTLRFEIRRLGGQDYSGILARMERVKDGLRIRDAMPLAPGAKHITYALILESSLKRLLPEPGKYEMRASIQDIDGVSGVSKPIVLKVGERSIGAIVTAEKVNRIVGRSLSLDGISQSVNKTLLESAVANLEECALRRAGLWLVEICQLRDSNSADDFRQCIESLSSVREVLPKVEVDCVSLILAQTYMDMGRPDLAQVELNRLSEDCYERRELQRVMRDNWIQ